MEPKIKILIVEDDLDYQEHYQKWLLNQNYWVKTSRTFEETREILETHYFDVIIADMHLEGDQQGGMKVLEEVERIGDITRVIVVSAELTREEVRDFVEKFGVSVLFKSEIGEEKLTHAVEQAIQKIPARKYGGKSLYNFLLKGRIPDNQISLISKNEDDFKKLLEDAFADIWPFNISFPVVVQPVSVLDNEYLIQISGWSRAINNIVVVRLGSRRIITKESHAYNKYVRGVDQISKSVKEGPFYNKDLGGLIYILSESQFESVHDFTKFYEEEDISQILFSIKNIVQASADLHKSRGVDIVNVDLKLVYKPMLEQVTGLKYIGKDKKKDSRPISLEEGEIDPIDFILKNDFIFENVPVGISHGELHGKNIIVDSKAQIWLLGFYCVDESDVALVPDKDSPAFRARQIGKRNLLHDYATLEVSIRKNLANIDSVELKEFDQALSHPRMLGEAISFPVAFSNARLEKAYRVIANLRTQAFADFTKNDGVRLYYSELLFQFVAIYLHLSDEIEKENIYHSVAILAKNLSKSP